MTSSGLYFRKTFSCGKVAAKVPPLLAEGTSGSEGENSVFVRSLVLSFPPVRGSGKSLHTPKALKRLFISCFFAEDHVKLFC